MPQGILLISWDEFEGPQVAFKVPDTLEVAEPVVQHIQISHNLIASWMITQEEGFNGISYYSPEHGYVILVVLDATDDGQDYKVIVEQINDFLLSSPEEDQIASELKKIFALTFSVYRARESVMMKLAQEVADLRMAEHDLKRNIEIIMKNIRDASTRILLYLILREPATFDQLVEEVNVSPTWLQSRLKALEEQKLIMVKNKQYWVAIE